MRLLTGLVAVALLATSCANLGRDTPICDVGSLDDFPGAHILQMQAVPTAEFGPCLNDLEAGWRYVHQVARDGQARFWLDSDRLGDRFLEVTLQTECDPGSASPSPIEHRQIERFIDLTKGIQPVDVTIVPVSHRQADYAGLIASELSAVRIEGRPIALRSDTTDSDPGERVLEAQQLGHFVLQVGPIEEEASNVLAFTNEPGSAGRSLDLEEALDEVGDRVEEAHYAASWFHVFEGGCIVYRFDAEGPGVESVHDAVEQAIGFFPSGRFRRQATERGFIIRSPE